MFSSRVETQRAIEVMGLYLRIFLALAVARTSTRTATETVTLADTMVVDGEVLRAAVVLRPGGTGRAPHRPAVYMEGLQPPPVRRHPSLPRPSPRTRKAGTAAHAPTLQLCGVLPSGAGASGPPGLWAAAWVPSSSPPWWTAGPPPRRGTCPARWGPLGGCSVQTQQAPSTPTASTRDAARGTRPARRIQTAARTRLSRTGTFRRIDQRTWLSQSNTTL